MRDIDTFIDSLISYIHRAKKPESIQMNERMINLLENYYRDTASFFSSGAQTDEILARLDTIIAILRNEPRRPTIPMFRGIPIEVNPTVSDWEFTIVEQDGSIVR